MRGQMPCVFFAFAHVCDTRGPFKLWVICTVATCSFVIFAALLFCCQTIGSSYTVIHDLILVVQINIL